MGVGSTVAGPVDTPNGVDCPLNSTDHADCLASPDVYIAPICGVATELGNQQSAWRSHVRSFPSAEKRESRVIRQYAVVVRELQTTKILLEYVVRHGLNPSTAVVGDGQLNKNFKEHLADVDKALADLHAVMFEDGHADASAPVLVLANSILDLFGKLYSTVERLVNAEKLSAQEAKKALADRADRIKTQCEIPQWKSVELDRGSRTLPPKAEVSVS